MSVSVSDDCLYCKVIATASVVLQSVDLLRTCSTIIADINYSVFKGTIDQLLALKADSSSVAPPKITPCSIYSM